MCNVYVMLSVSFDTEDSLIIVRNFLSIRFSKCMVSQLGAVFMWEIHMCHIHSGYDCIVLVPACDVFRMHVPLSVMS
jgi:hypothetical protein